MLAGLSRYYVLFMMIIGTWVHLMYSGDISSTEIVIKAYIPETGCNCCRIYVSMAEESHSVSNRRGGHRVI